MAKLLLVAGYVPSLVNFRGQLMRLLVANGHDVWAAAPLLEGQSYHVDALNAMGVKFIPLRLSRGGLNPFADFLAFFELLRLIRELAPNLVFAYTVKPVIYSGLAISCQRLLLARTAPVYVVLITGLGYAFTAGCGGLARRWLRRLLHILYRIGLLPAKAVVFQNPDDQSSFQSLKIVPRSADVHRIWGSGVDLSAFPPRQLATRPVFLMLSRLLADKGIREYVCAARQVKRRYPHAVFRLAGMLDNNPAAIDEAELHAWIDEGAIEYLGDLRQVQPALAACRFYVLPSYREGTPRSVLEALATARPVITTDAPGCRETVVHGLNGLLVPPRDVNALVTAMIQLIEQPDTETQRMAKASLDLVRDRFDVHKVNTQLLNVMGV